jgi:selenide,water dikinase
MSTRLTSFSHGAGCACKLGSSELSQVLHHLPLHDDVRVLVDASTRDDAAVFRIADDRALVATTDFFTPIVDDAFTWGAIAAANALSDVYAMGGQPLFGLNLVCWPRQGLSFDLLGEVLRGAADVTRRAGCPVLGGHSIDDAEPKFGMVVVGEVHPERMLTNAGAKPGDLLVLTKPIGTGILTTALKRDKATERDLQDAVTSMTTLNDGAARAAVKAGVRGATDVTGFGLLGHLSEMMAASGTRAELWLEAVPLLPRVLDLIGQGAVPGGTTRNLAAVTVGWEDGITDTDKLLLADAQTSGGLLIAVPRAAHSTLIDALKAEGTLVQATIGEVSAGGSDPLIDVRRTSGAS